MRRLRVYVSIILIFIVIVFLTNCATVFKGTTTDVNFESDPAGAEVYINGHKMGTTPVELKLESKNTYYIEFKKEGYETKIYNITNHVGANWVILDVICGLVPVVVDAATGSWYYLDQESINVIMETQ